MAEIARLGAALGPRLIWVRLPSCQGCPALRIRREEGNGTFAGRFYTAAYCAARPDGLDPLGTTITPYWRIDRAPPSWGPADG
jgi:hypothetical protein